MSWDMVKIGEVCTTGSGGTPARKIPEYYNGDIPWVKSGDLRENVVTTVTEYISDIAIQKSSAKIVSEGAILLAMYGATVGRMAILGIDAATNQAVCNIVPDEKRAFSKYVYYALRNKVPEFLRNAVGGAQPNINQGMIKDTKIPLPPLPEQKRIAALLDKADAIRRKRQQAIDLADDFLRSVFLDMFGDPVTNPKGWEVCTVDDVCIVQGGLQVSKKREIYSIKKPYLRVANVLRNKLFLDEIKYIGLTDNEYMRTKLEEDDILVVEGHGNKNEIGRSSIWDGSVKECVHQNHLIRVRVKSSKILPQIVNDFINSQGGRSQMLRTSNTTSGLNTISTRIVKNTKIFIPPLNIQNNYIKVIEKTKEAKKHYLLFSNLAENQFNALSQQAFAGKL